MPQRRLAARAQGAARRGKELTRTRDALSATRRELPMVEIEKEYVFQGPDGEATLLELFDGRRQLMAGHFMFDPRWEDGCPSCSAGVDLTALGRQEEWEEPKGRADSARSATPDFAS